MTFQKLMLDQRAAAIYSDLDIRTAPHILADNYLQAKLSGDPAQCVALEHFIRDMARVHFMRDGVLQALASMERHKSMRRPGKGGTADLKRIARKIREKFAAGDFERIPGVARDPDRVKFSIACAGSVLNVLCKDLPGAVELVACKYERGYKR